MAASDLIFHAGAECFALYGSFSKRTSKEEDIAETHTRSTTGYYVDRAGVLKIAEVNALRTEWTDATFSTPTTLVEGAATNLCLQSEVLATTWVNIRSTDSANDVSAPDGTTTADKIVDDGTASNTHGMQQSGSKASSALAYAYTLYAKADEYSALRLQVDDTVGNGFYADFDLSAVTAGTATTVGSGTVAGSARITAMGSGWYRCEVTGTSNTAAFWRVIVYMDDGTGTSYNGDSASGLHVWGVQLEQAAFASSYIQTTTVAVTRTADTLSLPFTAPPQEMTAYGKIINWSAGQVSGTLFHAGSATAATDPRWTLSTTSGGLLQGGYDDGTTAATTGTITAPTNGEALEYLLPLSAAGVVDLAIAIDGAAQVDTTSGAGGALPSTWADQRVYINSAGTTLQGYNRHESVKIARGTKTLAEMRTLGV